MKKLLTMFALGSSMMFAGCSDRVSSEKVITLQPDDKNVNTPRCIVEVACNEPELDAIAYDLDNPRKFYDFCDSTVTILAGRSGYSGPIYNVRSITDLHGSEKTEMELAAAKYKVSLGLK